MKIVFLSKLYPRLFREDYLRDSKAGLAAAADAHQYAIAIGLQKVCKDLDIINLPALFPYPLRHKKAFVESSIVAENGLNIRNIGYCNIQFVQPLSRYRNARKELEHIVCSTDDIVYIIVYSTAPYSLKASAEVKKKYRNVRLVMIVPDLPEDMIRHIPVLSFISEKIKSLFFKSFDEYIKSFDKFILLTKYMQEKIGCTDDDFIVSEGVYDETASSRTIQQFPSDKFRVFYSGMMHKRFGVMNLVSAISKIESTGIELVLCGYGDAVDEIKIIAQQDKRIKYLGVVPRDKALEWQTKSSLLVNPRIPDNNPFTRYSFPSKTMEYLASGTPTLLYELDGIPTEYYDYCYHLDVNHTDVESLAKMIGSIMNMDSSERKAFGLKARKFILEHKNATSCAQQIVEFIDTH